MESPKKIEYLRIIDGRGNIVKQYGKLDQVDIKIDINDLNTGLYILEINCINGVYVNRFVKK
ncbi:MAG: T9SS type A sorting domain-containing protein [Lewinellaceae bacterium]|nr:T9SS type A sorting domain-containing protein [Lewinellaceae bacterium]